jgi:hypothetical protein
LNHRSLSSLGLPLCSAALAGAFFAATPARASEVFPEVIRQTWDFDHAIPVQGSKGCRLCHSDEIGGTENVTQRFGRVIKEHYKVEEKQSAKLENALQDIRTRRQDTDADGVTDFAEIVEDSTNPNDSSDFIAPPPPPSEGGAGGETGAAGGTSAEAELPPTAPPLDLEDLPPPMGHGCAIGAPREPSLAHAAGLFVALGLWLRRRAARRGR